MLESMLGPDVMNKIIAKSSALICVILGWIGLIMIMMTSFIGLQVDKVDANGAYLETVTQVGIAHANLWPMLIGFFCGATALVKGGKKVKSILSLILLLLSLWVMLNGIYQRVPGPSLQGMGLAEGVAPLLVGVSVIGGFLGVLGGIVGMLGAIKFAK